MAIVHPSATVSDAKTDTGFPWVWFVIAAIFVICAAISSTFLLEDSFISFRYAENIAAGAGPVFNIGDKIEGYSNPLWVGILAVANHYGLGTITSARFLGVFFGALILLEILLLFRLADPGRRKFGTVAAVVVATSPAFLFWAQAGLENSLYMWLMFISLRLAIIESRNPRFFPISALTLFLLAITRPEGIMFFVVMAIWKIIDWKNRGPKFLTGRNRFWALDVIVLFGIFLLWRHAVFGEWVPNTFFAKVNNGIRSNFADGAVYLVGCLNHTLWLPVMIPSYLAIRWKSPERTESDPIISAIFLFIAAQALFILYTGGDIHPVDRFFLPIELLTIVGSFFLLPISLGPIWKQARTWLAIGLVIANLVYSYPPFPDIQPPINRPPNMLAANLAGIVSGRLTVPVVLNRFVSPPVDCLGLVGKQLIEENNAHDAVAGENNSVGGFPIYGWIGTDQCGNIPYWSKRLTFDLLGLNDTKVARLFHSVKKWGTYAEYVIDRLPDVVLVAFGPNRHLVSRYYLENTILSEPFQARYDLDKIYQLVYTFYDLSGREHSFSFKVLRFELKKKIVNPIPTDSEKAWFDQHQPIVDTPGALGDMVDRFMAANFDNPEKVITFHASMN